MTRLCYIYPINKKIQIIEGIITMVNDVVLIYIDDSPVFFARIESVLPDAKKDWYQIKLLLLSIPLQVVTWILKDAYITGQDFYMNGKKMKIQKVECPVEDLPLSKPSGSPDKIVKKDIKVKKDMDSKKPEPGKIISFPDRKKNI